MVGSSPTIYLKADLNVRGCPRHSTRHPAHSSTNSQNLSKDVPPFLTEVPRRSPEGSFRSSGQPQFFRLYRVQLDSPRP